MTNASPLSMPQPWDLVSSAYRAEIAPFFAEFAEEALLATGVEAGQQVLDVATGPGTLALLAAKRGARVTAIDFSPGMIDELRALAAQEGANIDAMVGDGMALPYPDAAYDAAFSMFGLMFFPDRGQGFRELLRVLKPAGRAAVSSWVPIARFPLLSEVFAGLRKAVPSMPPNDGLPPLGDIEIFRREMSTAGFRDVTVREITHASEAPSTTEFWRSAERATAPVAFMRNMVGEEEWTRISAVVLAHLRATFGDGPQPIVMTAFLGVGVKP